MQATVYSKHCKQCKQNQIFDNFYTGYATCKTCYRENHTKTLICIDCGTEGRVYFPKPKQRDNYRCHPCGVKHGIRRSFKDTAKHQAWKDRTDGRKMRAAVKNPYLPTNWKGGLPNCLDCGKQLCDRAFTLCRACSHKRRRKPKNTCNDCGVVLEKRRSTRCQPCRVKFQRGENAPMWKGGVSAPSQTLRNAHRSRMWSRAVMERDRFRCQHCSFAGDRKNPLHAHHKLRWAEHKDLRFDVSNGITLCRDCHLNVAHQGKWSNKPLNIWV